MSSERAGVHTSGTLNREQARGVLDHVDYHVSDDWSEVLDALEACVVQDPRIARIEALLTRAEFAEYEEAGPTYVQTDSIRAILRGDQ